LFTQKVSFCHYIICIGEDDGEVGVGGVIRG